MHTVNLSDHVRTPSIDPFIEEPYMAAWFVTMKKV